jgi:hypothetical protein
MSRDPIVEGVRRARERIAAECDYDGDKIYHRGCEILKSWQGKVVTQEEWLRGRAKRKPST